MDGYLVEPRTRKQSKTEHLLTENKIQRAYTHAMIGLRTRTRSRGWLGVLFLAFCDGQCTLLLWRMVSMKPAYWSMVVWASEDPRAWIVGASFPTQQSLNTWLWARLPTLTSTEDRHHSGHGPPSPQRFCGQRFWFLPFVLFLECFFSPYCRTCSLSKETENDTEWIYILDPSWVNGTTLHTLYLYIEDSSTEVSLRINESGHCIFMWPFLCAHKS